MAAAGCLWFFYKLFYGAFSCLTWPDYAAGTELLHFKLRFFANVWPGEVDINVPLNTEQCAEISDSKGDNHLANHIHFLFLNSWEPLQKHRRVFRLAPFAECWASLRWWCVSSLFFYFCFTLNAGWVFTLLIENLIFKRRGLGAWLVTSQILWNVCIIIF